MLSKKYNLKFLSSGLLYRYASFLILKHDPKDKNKFLRKSFKNLNYKNLNNFKLISPKISEHSALIAKTLEVRKISTPQSIPSKPGLSSIKIHCFKMFLLINE